MVSSPISWHVHSSWTDCWLELLLSLFLFMPWKCTNNSRWIHIHNLGYLWTKSSLKGMAPKWQPTDNCGCWSSTWKKTPKIKSPTGWKQTWLHLNSQRQSPRRWPCERSAAKFACYGQPSGLWCICFSLADLHTEENIGRGKINPCSYQSDWICWRHACS